MNNNDYIFSYAEDEHGRIVYVDEVPRGEKCGCICPCCREKLLARQGEERKHHFAHISVKGKEFAQQKNKRGANLEMCYQVIVYKLAEQIVKTQKRIHVPSYYGFFPARDIDFKSVDIDSQYEREDKQPDIIAVAEDGKRYLIEFIFKYKVQHKQGVDYKNLNCLQVDLSNQSQDYKKLEDFLLNEEGGRQWINNQDYFNAIEARCQQGGKPSKLLREIDCAECIIKSRCVAATDKNTHETIEIENNGIKYKLCQQILFKEQIDQFEKSKDERGIVNKGEGYEEAARVKSTEFYESESKVTKVDKNTSDRSCSNCIHNVKKDKDWRCFCDCYDDSYGHNSKRGYVNSDFANTCEDYCCDVNH